MTPEKMEQREPVMDAILKIELADSEAMADAVMEHLGPLALTHGHISPIDAFELGWKARAQTLASKEAELVRLREARGEVQRVLVRENGRENGALFDYIESTLTQPTE